MSRPKPSNKSLFLAAIEIESEAERAAFLQQACGDNDHYGRKLSHCSTHMAIRRTC